jgi:hypothetical protein
LAERVREDADQDSGLALIRVPTYGSIGPPALGLAGDRLLREDEAVELVGYSNRGHSRVAETVAGVVVPLERGLVLSARISVGFSGGPVVRGDRVVGLILGTDLPTHTVRVIECGELRRRLGGWSVPVDDDDAARIARLTVGPSVFGAHMLTRIGAPIDTLVAWIPAAAADSAAHRRTATLVMISGKDPIYHVRQTYQSAYDMFWGEESDTTSSLTAEYVAGITGVEDVDLDGFPEVYWIYREGGSGAYSITMSLLDPRTDQVYELNGFAGYQDPTVDFAELSDNLAGRPEISRWLETRLRMVVDSREVPADPNAFDCDRASRAWVEDNGLGFLEGALRVRFYDEDLPDFCGSITCEIREPRYHWIAYFKNFVAGYDKTLRKSYVVFVPAISYDWVSYMTSGAQYLWMWDALDDGLLALDKRARVLRIFRIPFAPVATRDADRLTWEGQVVHGPTGDFRFPVGFDVAAEFRSVGECVSE